MEPSTNPFESGMTGFGPADWALRPFLELLLDQLAQRPGAAVLDVGAEDGALLGLLRSKTAFTGYGMSPDEETAEKARQQHPAIEFRVGSPSAVPFEDRRFDIVIALLYAMSLEQAAFPHEAARLLRPHGEVIVADVRIPGILRSVINHFVRNAAAQDEEMAGTDIRLLTPKQIAARFAPAGFRHHRTVARRFARLTILTRP